MGKFAFLLAVAGASAISILGYKLLRDRCEAAKEAYLDDGDFGDFGVFDDSEDLDDLEDCDFDGCADCADCCDCCDCCRPHREREAFASCVSRACEKAAGFIEDLGEAASYFEIMRAMRGCEELPRPFERYNSPFADSQAEGFDAEDEESAEGSRMPESIEDCGCDADSAVLHDAETQPDGDKGAVLKKKSKKK